MGRDKTKSTNVSLFHSFLLHLPTGYDLAVGFDEERGDLKGWSCSLMRVPWRIRRLLPTS
jgi:hypothetical protein